MTSTVLYDLDPTTHVATITLNRPEAMNSLTNEAKNALRDLIFEVSATSEARALVLRGSGRAFCVGQDLNELVADMETGVISDTVTEHFNPMVRAIWDMPKPVIAAINGTAAGAGLSLALAADFRIAAQSAKFTTSFAKIGLSCDTGISWTLPRIVGRAKALDLLLTSRVIDSTEALEIGLIDRVVADADFDAAVTELATSLASSATIALASIKRAVNFAETADMDAALEYEKGKMSLTGATTDHQGAVRAFLAKEPPQFTGA